MPCDLKRIDRYATAIEALIAALATLRNEADDLTDALDIDDHLAMGDIATNYMDDARRHIERAIKAAGAAVNALDSDPAICPECGSNQTDAADRDHAEGTRDRACLTCDHRWNTRR